MQNILCIPADSFGNKLWVKDFKVENNRILVNYSSTYSKMPFQETELFVVDGGKNLAILGDDSTVLFRFPVDWLDKFKD